MNKLHKVSFSFIVAGLVLNGGLPSVAESDRESTKTKKVDSTTSATANSVKKRSSDSEENTLEEEFNEIVIVLMGEPIGANIVKKTLKCRLRKDGSTWVTEGACRKPVQKAKIEVVQRKVGDPDAVKLRIYMDIEPNSIKVDDVTVMYGERKIQDSAGMKVLEYKSMPSAQHDVWFYIKDNKTVCNVKFEDTIFHKLDK